MNIKNFSTLWIVNEVPFDVQSEVIKGVSVEIVNLVSLEISVEIPS